MWYNYTALGVNKTLDSVVEMNSLEKYIDKLPANQVLYHGYYSFVKSTRDFLHLPSTLYTLI